MTSTSTTVGEESVVSSTEQQPMLGYRADTEAQKAKEKLRKTQETREKIAAKKRKT